MILRIGDHYINTDQVTYWQVGRTERTVGQPSMNSVWVYFDNSAGSAHAIKFNGVEADAVAWWLERNGGEDLLNLYRLFKENTSR